MIAVLILAAIILAFGGTALLGSVVRGLALAFAAVTLLGLACAAIGSLSTPTRTTAECAPVGSAEIARRMIDWGCARVEVHPFDGSAPFALRKE